MTQHVVADVILHHGLFTTLDKSNPTASAVAVKDGKFLAVGGDAEIMAFAGPATKVVDLKGKRVLPGLIDNHTHVVRGGLNYNMELRWDGVRSLADAMDMLRRQVAITRHRSGFAWLAVLLNISLWKSVCQPSKRSTPLRRTPRCFCCISMTVRS